MAKQEQESLLYSFVARDNVILAEHSVYDGDYIQISKNELNKPHPENSMNMYEADTFTYVFSFANGLAYGVVAVYPDYKLPMAYLERIKKVFTKSFEGEAVTADANRVKEYGLKLKEEMQNCVHQIKAIGAMEDKVEKVHDHEVNSQMEGVLYAFVAENEQVVARSDLTSYLTVIGEKFLGRFPHAEKYTRYDFKYGGYRFSFGVEKDTTYGVVSNFMSNCNVEEAVITKLFEKLQSDHNADEECDDLSSNITEYLKACNYDARSFILKLKKTCPFVHLETTEDQNLLALGAEMRKNLVSEDMKSLRVVNTMKSLLTSAKAMCPIVKQVLNPKLSRQIDGALEISDSGQRELRDRLAIEEVFEFEADFFAVRNALLDTFGEGGKNKLEGKRGAPGGKNKLIDSVAIEEDLSSVQNVLSSTFGGRAEKLPIRRKGGAFGVEEIKGNGKGGAPGGKDVLLTKEAGEVAKNKKSRSAPWKWSEEDKVRMIRILREKKDEEDCNKVSSLKFLEDFYSNSDKIAPSYNKCMDFARYLKKTHQTTNVAPIDAYVEPVADENAVHEAATDVDPQSNTLVNDDENTENA